MNKYAERYDKFVERYGEFGSGFIVGGILGLLLAALVLGLKFSGVIQ